MAIEHLFADLPELHTPRLLLRKLRPEDIDDVFAYTADPDAFTYIRRLPHASRAEAEQWVNGIVADYTRNHPAPWGIEQRESGRIIGTCGYVFLDRINQRTEIYYALARAHWNRGYITEAVHRVIRFSFEEIGLNRVEAYCWVGNQASARVLEKVGMQFEGVVRHAVFAKGAFRDMRLYSLLRQDFTSSVPQV